MSSEIEINKSCFFLSFLGWGNTSSVAAGVRTTQPPSYNSSIGLGLNSSSSFGNATLPSQSNDFQLQKPPTGNKRGKH